VDLDSLDIAPGKRGYYEAYMEAKAETDRKVRAATEGAARKVAEERAKAADRIFNEGIQDMQSATLVPVGTERTGEVEASMARLFRELNGIDPADFDKMADEVANSPVSRKNMTRQARKEL